MAVALYDNYPVSPGHTPIVPRRHIPDFLAMTQEE
jgi:diadenosine tetraphosphate (Ap4A) HIT family hydrolase